MRAKAFALAVAATVVGMVVSGIVVSAGASLLALAAGLSVMFVLVVARRSTFRASTSRRRWVQRSKRYVQSLCIFGASLVAMTWVGALGSWQNALFTLCCGLFAAVILALLPLGQQTSVTPRTDVVEVTSPEE